MNPYRKLFFTASLLFLVACGSNPATPENIEMECANMERMERERCLEYHNGSYDQNQREKLKEKG